MQDAQELHNGCTIDDSLFGLNKLLCLPKAELNAKNSTKRRGKASFG